MGVGKGNRIDRVRISARSLGGVMSQVNWDIEGFNALIIIAREGSMKVRDDQNRVLVLTHFTISKAASEVLRDMKQVSPNALVQACEVDKPFTLFLLPVFRLQLDHRSLRELNPRLY